MYESYFHFRNRPFPAAPQPKFYFPAETMDAARKALTRCIERGAGPALLIGPTGTGKTLLCHVLAKYFRPSSLVALLTSTHLCTRRALLQAILYELDLRYRDLEEGELRLSLIEHLTRRENTLHGLVLVVDEAHVLPLKLLEEIRMLSNLVRDGQLRVQVVLAGNVTFEERFALPQLESFNQRLAARCYLQSMNLDETFGYVQSHLKEVGGTGEEIFSKDAFQAIYRVSDGIPRLISQVCDHALILACAGGRRRIQAAGIEEAWADLQQLPVPSTTSTSEAPGTSPDAIEFGSLHDHPSVDSPQTESDMASAPAESSMFGGNSSDSDPEQRFDELQERLAQASDDLTGVPTEDAIAPESDRAREDSAVPVAHNPFTEPFEEEEVIIDPLGHQTVGWSAPSPIQRDDSANLGHSSPWLAEEQNERVVADETRGILPEPTYDTRETTTSEINQLGGSDTSTEARIAPPASSDDPRVYEVDEKPASTWEDELTLSASGGSSMVEQDMVEQDMVEQDMVEQDMVERDYESAYEVPTRRQLATAQMGAEGLPSSSESFELTFAEPFAHSETEVHNMPQSEGTEELTESAGDHLETASGIDRETASLESSQRKYGQLFAKLRRR